MFNRWFVLLMAAMITDCALGATAGQSSRSNLVIAADGHSQATIVVATNAGVCQCNKTPQPARGSCNKSDSRHEWQAAADLQHYITLMTGAQPKLATEPEDIKSALADKKNPVLLVGSIAIEQSKRLRKQLDTMRKPAPILRTDGIALLRRGNRVYMAGLTDDGHYHAVVELLSRWGCRWYLPTEFGECIPQHHSLAVGKLVHQHASPFEMRYFWNAWNGSQEGLVKFQLRNRMTIGVKGVGAGHNLKKFTKELIPEGKSAFDVPIADDSTVAHVAEKLDTLFRDHGTVSLAMEDGIYLSDSKVDEGLRAGIKDKYFMSPSVTDVFMSFYNGVCERLLEKYPDSKARVGFLAYCNMTIPPQQITKAAKPLFCALAPIDIDPNHHMDDFRSPPRQEYRDMVFRWSKIMDGRVWIYDYDQSMLVWRDLPNPSHHIFRHDVKRYAEAGILGFGTESRGAIATTFLNMFMRGQLMWHPDFDVDAALAEFYPAFYGPAAEPMANYWSAIYQAWENTLATEHEFFIIPSIYTPELVARLRPLVVDAEAKLQVRPDGIADRHWDLYQQRMQFTRASFDLIAQYSTMVHAAASRCDYAGAHALGKEALATRLRLAKMNPTFTTRVLPPAEEPAYGGSPAWLPGEVKMYGDLDALSNGQNGQRVAELPLTWAFRRDPNDTGIVSGFADRPVNLNFWHEHRERFDILTRKDYPTTEWEEVRTDLYPQAQGVLHPDGQSYTGHAWYRTDITLKTKDSKGITHIRFPGVFGRCWLWVNGVLVAHRPQHDMWWKNNYGFNWDVDISSAIKPGKNTIALRVGSEHHISGMFRRPFIYRLIPKSVAK